MLRWLDPPPPAGEVPEGRRGGTLREDEKKTVAKARALRRTMTKAEVILWQNLRARQLGGFKFRRQVPVGPFIADFACVEGCLIVEVDGGTHSEPDEVARDARRTAFLEQRGWRVLRIWNSDVYENLPGVLENILDQLQQGGHD